MKLQALLGLCAHSICASGDIVNNAYMHIYSSGFWTVNIRLEKAFILL
jgi:hypothetical protein